MKNRSRNSENYEIITTASNIYDVCSDARTKTTIFIYIATKEREIWGCLSMRENDMRSRSMMEII